MHMRHCPEVINKINKENSENKILWVPSHIGMKVNKEADQSNSKYKS